MRRPLAWVGLAVVLGAVSWPWWRPALGPLLFGVGYLGLLAWAGRRWRVSALALVTSAFLLGAAAPEMVPSPPGEGESERLRGEVVAASGRRAVMAADGGGRVELWFSEDAPRPGVRPGVWTKPSVPMAQLPGDWGWPHDLERAGLRSLRVRAWARLGGGEADGEAVARQARFRLAENGGLLWAFASGDRGEVPEETAALLRRTGTAHLLAISGLHIGLVGGMAWAVGWWLARPLALLRWPWPARLAPALIGLAGAWGYGALVGWPVSAQRAVIMIAAAVMGQAAGRRADAWSLLGIAAAAVVLVDPGQVSQPGFWMSFGAVAGILAWSRAVTRLLPLDHPAWLGWVVGSLAASLGATLGTLPVIAWLFQMVSPLSPLTNLVASPLMAGVAVPGALLADRLPGGAGLLALAVADSAAGLTLGMLRALDVPPWTPAVGLGGAVLLSAVLLLRRQPVAAAGLALLALGLREQPAGDWLRVSFLSIGQGDATLVEWPDGRRWLIDGGPPSERLLRYLRRRGIRRLDAVLLSHPDADHLGGLLPVMDALEVRALWVPRPPLADETDYRTLWGAAFRQGTAIRTPADAALLGAGERGVTLLHPLDGWAPQRTRRLKNEQSLVLRIDHGARSLLLTGDIEREGEAAVAERLAGRPVDVVKVAHHGSTSSSTEPFVAATGADWAIISCGLDNRFRHPRPIVLWRWTAAGARVLRTDLLGTVVVETDGEALRLSAPRSGHRWHAPAPADPPPPARADAEAAPPSAG